MTEHQQIGLFSRNEPYCSFSAAAEHLGFGLSQHRGSGLQQAHILPGYQNPGHSSFSNRMGSAPSKDICKELLD
jgi:hypothetical protein